MTPVIQLSKGAYVVCVSPRVPARNLQELLTHARENPGKLTFASAGNGSHLHIVTEYLFGMAKVKATHVPRSEEHTSELQSQSNLVCRLLLEKKKKKKKQNYADINHQPQLQMWHKIVSAQ